MTERSGWDSKSEYDFGEAECDFINLAEQLDREWVHVEDGKGLRPDAAIAQLERIKSTVNFMLQAAKWAR